MVAPVATSQHQLVASLRLVLLHSQYVITFCKCSVLFLYFNCCSKQPLVCIYSCNHSTVFWAIVMLVYRSTPENAIFEKIFLAFCL